MATLHDVKFYIEAVCHKCNLRHKIECDATRFTSEFADWERKHPEWKGCLTEYFSPKRVTPRFLDDSIWNSRGIGPQWMEYGENTNFNFTFRASAAVTNAIASLATSATLVAGYESATIDNSSNNDLDILVTALVTVGTTPTVNTIIEIHSVAMRDDSTWPDVFDGTTSAETITSTGVKDNIVNPLAFLNVSATTSNVGYEMTQQSLASRYGGVCPRKSSFFTVHNTGVNLNSTGGNHVFTQVGVYIVGA